MNQIYLSLLFFLILVFLSSFPLLTKAYEWDEQERGFLMELLLPGKDSIEFSLAKEFSTTDHCFWTGVVCNQNGKVTELTIYPEKLDVFREEGFELFKTLDKLIIIGTLPESLSRGLNKLTNASHLEIIVLFINIVIPDIFDEVSQLETLIMLGEFKDLPDSFYRLKNLKKLELNTLGEFTTYEHQSWENLNKLESFVFAVGLYYGKNFDFSSPFLQDFLFANLNEPNNIAQNSLPTDGSSLSSFICINANITKQFVDQLFSFKQLLFVYIIDSVSSEGVIEIPSTIGEIPFLLSLSLKSPCFRGVPENVNQLTNLFQLEFRLESEEDFPNLDLSFLSSLSIDCDTSEQILIDMRKSNLTGVRMLEVTQCEFEDDDLTSLPLTYFSGYLIRNFPSLDPLVDSIHFTLKNKWKEWPENLLKLNNLVSIEWDDPNGLIPSFPYFLFTKEEYSKLTNIGIGSILDFSIDQLNLSFELFENIGSFYVGFPGLKVNFTSDYIPPTLTYLGLLELNFEEIQVPRFLSDPFFTTIEIIDSNFHPLIPNEFNKLRSNCNLHNSPPFYCQSFYPSYICEIECSVYFESGVWRISPFFSLVSSSGMTIEEGYLSLVRNLGQISFNLDIVSYLSSSSVVDQEQSQANQTHILLKYSRKVDLIETRDSNVVDVMFEMKTLIDDEEYDLMMMVEEGGQTLIEVCGGKFEKSKWVSLVDSCDEWTEECVEEINKVIPVSSRQGEQIESDSVVATGKMERETQRMMIKEGEKVLQKLMFGQAKCLMKDDPSLQREISIERQKRQENWTELEKMKTGCGSLEDPYDCCGDGEIILFEKCDDGNNANGDGCSNDCQIEIGWTCDPKQINNQQEDEDGGQSNTGVSECFYICPESGELVSVDQNCTSSSQNYSNDDKTSIIIGVFVGVVVVIAFLVWLILIKDKSNENYIISEDEIKFGEVLGEGHFGQVLKGEWKGTTSVAIKIVKMKQRENEAKELEEALKGFKEEAKLYTQIPPHPNIVQLLGIVLPTSKSQSGEEGTKVMIVLEFLQAGSLDVWMSEKAGELSPEQDLILQVGLAKGIAAGLHHLHKCEIVHRDLAARNILLQMVVSQKEQHKGVIINSEGLGYSLIPKLGDFGLSTTMKGRNLVPIRWSAPEVLESSENSSYKSDVWSYGVVLIEISSHCEDLPYGSLKNKEIFEFLKSRRCLVPPSNTHPQIQTLISSCFIYEPSLRPNIEQIFNMIRSFEKDLESKLTEESSDSSKNYENKFKEVESTTYDELKTIYSERRVSQTEMYYSA